MDRPSGFAPRPRPHEPIDGSVDGALRRRERRGVRPLVSARLSADDGLFATTHSTPRTRRGSPAGDLLQGPPRTAELPAWGTRAAVDARYRAPVLLRRAPRGEIAHRRS